MNNSPNTTPDGDEIELQIGKVLTELENAVEASTLARLNGRTMNNRMFHAKAMTEIADILSAHTEAKVREAERRGEVSQVKMILHWMQAHNVAFDPEDAQHILDSLEQAPEQPLASENLAALQKVRREMGEAE